LFDGLLPDIGSALCGKIKVVVPVHVVQLVPQVGVHDDAVDAEPGMGVNVRLLERTEFFLSILDTPGVSVAFIELPQLVFVNFAEEAFFLQVGLVCVQGRQKTAQVGDVLCQDTVAVPVHARSPLRIHFQMVVTLDDVQRGKETGKGAEKMHCFGWIFK
jgi:hypothetical protein